MSDESFFQPAALRSAVQQAFQSLQEIHGGMADWSGTKVLVREDVEDSIVRVEVIGRLLQEAAQRTRQRFDEADGVLGFDGVPDGRVRELFEPNVFGQTPADHGFVIEKTESGETRVRPVELKDVVDRLASAPPSEEQPESEEESLEDEDGG